MKRCSLTAYLGILIDGRAQNVLNSTFAVRDERREGHLRRGKLLGRLAANVNTSRVTALPIRRVLLRDILGRGWLRGGLLQLAHRVFGFLLGS